MQVNATYADGYRVVAVCPIIGPRAAEKAQKTADAILSRYDIKRPFFFSFCDLLGLSLSLYIIPVCTYIQCELTTLHN